VLLLVALSWLVAGAAADDPPTVDSLCAALASGDAAARREALHDLSGRYPEGAAAVPLLVDALADDDAGVRAAAGDALTALGRRGLERYRALLADTQDAAHPPFSRALDGAAQSRGRLQPTALCILMVPGEEPAIRTAGTLASGLVRGTPADAEPILDVLVDLLEDDLADVRAAAAAALSLRGLDAVAGRRDVAPVPEARAALSGEPVGLRYAAVRLLAIAGSGGAEVVTALGEAAGEESGLLSLAACEALGRLGASARPVASALERVLQRGDRARFAAADALVRAGESGRVEARLADEKGEIRHAAAWALSLDEARRKAALPVLAAWLEEERSETSGWTEMPEVASALARLGPAAAGTAPVLRDVLQRRSEEDRVAAARALVAVAPPGEDAIAMLCRVLERTPQHQPNPRDARAALDALIDAGRLAEPALPALELLLRYRDSDADRERGRVAQKVLVRSHAFDQLRRMKLRVVEVLANLGPAGSPAKPRLARMLEGNDLRLRYRAARALRRIDAGD